MTKKYVLVTGSNGFIGKNLIINLRANKDFLILDHKRTDSLNDLKKKIFKSSLIVHCAAEVKSKSKKNFYENNVTFTESILKILNDFDLKKKIIYLSTTQIIKKNEYGITKKKSEELFKLLNYDKIKYQVFRLPNIYGKFAKIKHNSVVANFCHNISRNKKIYVSNYSNKVELLYIDNLIKIIITYLNNKRKFSNNILTLKEDAIVTLRELVEIIKKFKNDSHVNHTPNFTNNFISNLYSTYVSYLPSQKRKSTINMIKDKRGSFGEIFKSKNFGQVSLLKIKTSETRGNHFHNSKIERFFVISGRDRKSVV